jgi:replication factor C subunit 2/4
LGENNYQAGVLELNASDARGIDVVRNKIKAFCQSKVTLPPNRHKIVILDEADSMTAAAQQAMRRTMEIYSKTTRFALACNVSTKIIEPIQSRAAILRYSKLADEQVLTRIRHVCQEEQVSYDTDGLEALLFTAEGDLRNALNNLQATVSGFGHVSAANVWKVCDQPHPATVREIIDACHDSDLKLAKQRVEALWRTGYSSTDIVGTLFRVTKAHQGLEEGMLLEFLREIGFAQMRIAEGVDSLLQLLGLVSRLCQTAARLKNANLKQ